MTRRRRTRYGAPAPSRARVREPDLLPSAVYVESSSLVAACLENDAATRAAIEATPRRIASALTFAEAHRAIARGVATRVLKPAQAVAAARELRRQAGLSEILAVSAEVLARVERPFPSEPVRTLDAIHLATIERLGLTPEELWVATRDARVAANARAWGYLVS